MSETKKFGLFLVYSCTLPIYIKVYGSCHYPQKNLRFSGASLHFEERKTETAAKDTTGRLGLRVSCFEFKPQICYLGASQFHVNYFATVNLSFLIYKVGLMTDPPHRLVVRIKSDKAWEGHGPVPAPK